MHYHFDITETFEAMSVEEAQPRQSLDFAESSVLEAIAPAASHIDIEEAFNSWDGTIQDETASILPFIKQRHVLLFGTYCSVRVLRQPSYLYTGL